MYVVEARQDPTGSTRNGDEHGEGLRSLVRDREATTPGDEGLDISPTPPVRAPLPSECGATGSGAERARSASDAEGALEPGREGRRLAAQGEMAAHPHRAARGGAEPSTSLPALR